MESIAKLGIEIDSSGAVTGAANLERLAAGGQKAEQAVRSFAGAAQTAAAAQVAAARAALEQARALGQAGAAEQKAAADALALARANQVQVAAATAATRATTAQAQAARLAAEASEGAGRAVQTFGRNLQGGAGGIGNFAAQLQDISVQAAAGTDSLIILAQQGPQIASGFGPVGAVIGVAVAAAAAGVIAFRAFGDENVTAASATDALNDALSRSQETIGATANSITELTARYASLSAQQREVEANLLRARIDETGEALATGRKALAQTAAEVVTTRVEEVGRPLPGFTTSPAVQAEVGALQRITELQQKIATGAGSVAEALELSSILRQYPALVEEQNKVVNSIAVQTAKVQEGEEAFKRLQAELATLEQRQTAAQAALIKNPGSEAAGQVAVQAAANVKRAQDQLAELEERARLVGNERAQAVAAARRAAPEGASGAQLDQIGEAAGRLFDLERANQAATEATRERERATKQATDATARDAKSNLELIESLQRQGLKVDDPREAAIQSAVARLKRPESGSPADIALFEQQVVVVRDLAAANFDEAEAAKIRNDEIRLAEQLFKRIRTPQEELAEQSRIIAGLYDDEVISLDERNRALAKAGEIAAENTRREREAAIRERRATDPVFDAGLTLGEDASDRLDGVRNSAALTTSTFNDLNSAATDAFTGASTAAEAFDAVLVRLNERLISLALDAFVLGPIEQAIGAGVSGGFGSFFGGGAGVPGQGGNANLTAAAAGPRPLFPAGVLHGGGTVGAAGAATRMVDPMLFAVAPRLHSGLAPDEFPAILQRGERVQSRREVAAGAMPAIRVNVTNNGEPVSAQANARRGADGGIDIDLELTRKVQGVIGSGQADKQLGRFGGKPVPRR